MKARPVKITIEMITDATVQELKDDYRQTSYPSNDIITSVRVEIVKQESK